jgi:hypothetical protein
MRLLRVEQVMAEAPCMLDAIRADFPRDDVGARGKTLKNCWIYWMRMQIGGESFVAFAEWRIKAESERCTKHRPNHVAFACNLILLRCSPQR